MEYPLFNSKKLSDGKVYNLTDPVDRRKYFESKLGSKIEQVKDYLDRGSFVGYLLAKKQAGKGTYSKMIEEILGPERFAHISVGDVVRDYHNKLENAVERDAVLQQIKKDYRGPISVENAITALLNRTQGKVSVPTELILTLLRLEITKMGRKALFIDGLPRTTDQVSHSLFFRNLINYRDDPDFFVMIQVEDEMIDARMKSRVVCPLCHTPKNLMTNPTKFICQDSTTNEYYYLCDNASCVGYEKTRLECKEGDAAGVASIADRMRLDEEVMATAMNFHGIGKVLIRSAVPIDVAHEYMEDYEIQPRLKFKGVGGNVTVTSEPWIFKDNAGVESCTMYAATYVLNIFSQIHALLML